MTSEKPASDLAMLASEVCDLWQDYITALTAEPAAKAEFIRLLEPQRRAFADFLAMMQHAGHAGENATRTTGGKAARQKHGRNDAPAPLSASAATSSDDGAGNVAELAHRVAELEKRLGQIEHAIVAAARRKGASETPRGRGEPH